MSVHDTKQVHFGPDLRLSNAEPIHLSFNVLLACLFKLDSAMFLSILQRFQPQVNPEKVRVPPKKPWKAFYRFMHGFADGIRQELQQQMSFVISDDLGAQLFTDLRKTAEAVFAYSLVEKILGTTPLAQQETIHDVCFTPSRVELMLEWVDIFGTNSLQKALQQEFLHQAAALQEAYPDLWDEFIADDWAGIDTSSAARLHDELVAVAQFIYHENLAGLQRCSDSGMEPLAIIQEETSLLTLGLVALYQAYPHAEVQAAMAEAAQLVGQERLMQLAQEVPQAPPPPQKKPRPNWLSVVK